MPSEKMKATKAYKLKQNVANKLKQNVGTNMRTLLLVVLSAVLLTTLVVMRFRGTPVAVPIASTTIVQETTTAALPSTALVKAVTVTTYPPGAPTPHPELGRIEYYPGTGVTSEQLGGIQLHQVKVHKKDGTVYHHHPTEGRNLRKSPSNR
jgi:hypothetical protein